MEMPSFLLGSCSNSIFKKIKYHHKFKRTLDDKNIRDYLKTFHEKYVITPTDKAGNNFSIVCKEFYINCLLKELYVHGFNIEKKSQTYKRL